MWEGVERFLSSLREGKRVASPHTVAAYRNDLGQFVEWLTGHGVETWGEVQHDHVVSFLRWLGEQGYAASTVTRRLAAVRSLFRFFVLEGTLKDDPSVLVSPPSVRRPFPRILGRDEVDCLLEKGAQGETPKALRDRALLELMYATGMRAGEVVSLEVGDVDIERGEVRCGRRRERVISLPGRVVEALQRYLEDGRPRLASSLTRTLFVNLRGRPLTRQGLWLVVRGCARRAGVKGEVTPHVLRHSCAVHRLAQGERLEDVRRLLGHTHLSTTRIYAGIAEGFGQRADRPSS